MSRTCRKCKRALPLEAFATTSPKLCRDCARSGYLQAQGLEAAKNSVTCPLCSTIVANWRSHYRKYHPGDKAVIPLVEVNTEGAEDLVQSILMLQSTADSHWTWDRKASRVYFLQAGGPGRPIKIGFSTNLANRMVDIQDSNPETLTVLFTQEGTREDERALHAKFRDHWIGGEWFRAHRTLLAHILDKVLELPGTPEREKRLSKAGPASFNEHRQLALKLKILTRDEWFQAHDQGSISKRYRKRPELLPEWKGWEDFLRSP